jgi:hypothetical protein
LIFLSNATKVGQVLDRNPSPGPASDIAGTHRGEDRLGLQGGDVLLCHPGDQFGQQPLQPVHGLHPLASDLLAALDQQSHRLELAVFGQHPQVLGPDRNHSNCMRVVGVGLAVVAGVEQPRPG